MFQKLNLISVSTIVMFLVVFAAFAGSAEAANYYISPSGSDSSTGSSSTPWKTFSHAVANLMAGDTLILKDGTYNAGNSGYLRVNCSVTKNNGTAGSPITVQAENERKAFIDGSAGNGTPIEIFSCAYWNFYGLRAATADVSGANYDVADVWNSDSLTFRRMLLSNTNRNCNCTLLLLYNTSNSLVEESEFYNFHRNGLMTKYGVNNELRRNYANSRLYADIPGYTSNYPSRGDAAFNPYPGSNIVVENNFSENNGTGFDVQAAQLSDGNQILGNISLNDFYGVTVIARESYPTNTVIRDQLVINPVNVGIYHRGGSNGHASNVSVISNGASTWGVIADLQPSTTSAPSPSFFCTNCLSLNTSTGYGFNIVNQSSWLIDYSNAYGGSTTYSPSKSSLYQNVFSVDPQLKTPYVFVPPSSPMRGAGKNGDDIGANILYRYVNGVLTTQPLWDPVSGAFPCGAVIAGLNDVKGASCFDLNVRLNVTLNTLPVGYATLPLSAPQNFRVVDMTTTP